MVGPYPPPNQWNTFPADIEKIKSIVAKFFPIYEVRVSYDTVSLYCSVDRARLDDDFDKLRKEMRGQNYVPILVYEGGEHIVHVVRTPPVKPTGVWVNLIFLVVTVVTTIVAGAFAWQGYVNEGDAFSPEMLAMGCLTFALPLLLILGAHELSHYYAAKRHGIAASLPFFIPSWPPLGTFGAFISIREPIPNRKALLDIGAAGPIASFLLSIPITIAGLWLTANGPVHEVQNVGGSTYIGPSVFFALLNAFVPIPGNHVIHPLAFAGWVGLFVTALNLLPAGQLDGGHIARALLGDRAKYASYGAMAMMVALGLLFYMGWLIFAALIFFLGMRHPPPLNDVTRLDESRKLVGVGLAAVLILCFVPIPMGEIAMEDSFYYATDAHANGTALTDVNLIAQSSTSPTQVSYSFDVLNDGNTRLNISLYTQLNKTLLQEGWDALVSVNGTGQDMDRMDVLLDSGESAEVEVTVIVPPGAHGTEGFSLIGNGRAEGEDTIMVTRTLEFRVTVP